ncbi:glycosyltransferase family 4 protein [Caldibacillus debilis]|jgi:glycosyltransferase EpsD|uniref:Glycosyltransferase n=1 Tax=Caldibacillus debilis GB1 TaxID=1339248 RepID=A0A420VGQ6_9BACI|nr:glycosyltransferase family 4 protein [Caldibacillus debilis]RKO62834.1 Glycosyltransferase [Caldibacillus debilis GB1]
MKKILFTATVDSHILNFHIPYIKWFREKGYEVHVASNGTKNIPYVTKKFNIPFERAPFKLVNFKAYKELKYIIENNDYVLIHCHTPVGSVITRLAAKNARKKGTKIIYTAHGFHFFKGAPLKNWLFYYPIEKWLSKYTDCIITINDEDYQIAKNKFKTKKVERVNGVGVDLKKFTMQTKEMKSNLRNKYKYDNSDFILFFAAELNKNKHQDLLIKATSIIKNKIPQVKLLLAGDGPLKDFYKKLANQLGVKEYVEFLGYRKDIQNLLCLSDVVVSSSRREGLPVNIMEAMATGLPLVVTNCRGNRDLVKNKVNGFVVALDDVLGLVNSIEQIFNSKELKEKYSLSSLEMVQKYSLDSVLPKMEEIYYSYLR